MSKKPESPFINLGFSSLLVVFLVLCLVIFAALSLTAANNNLAFSQRMADRKTAYYDACGKAEALLDRLDGELCASGFDSDFSGLGMTRQGDCLTFSVPVGTQQQLSVQVRLTPDGAHYYEIESWKIITTAPSGEETLPLMTIGDA